MKIPYKRVLRRLNMATNLIYGPESTQVIDNPEAYPKKGLESLAMLLVDKQNIPYNEACYIINTACPHCFNKIVETCSTKKILKPITDRTCIHCASLTSDRKFMVSREDTTNFLKYALSVVYYMRGDGVVGPYYEQAIPFIKGYGLRIITTRRIARAIANRQTIPDELYKELAKQIRAIIPFVLKNLDIKQEQLLLLKDASIYLNTESEAAYKRICNSITQLNTDELTQAFTPVIQYNQKDKLQQLKSVVQKMTGDYKSRLNPKQAKKMRVKEPHLYKEYLRFNRECLHIYKEAIRKIVRDSGRPLMNVKKAKHMLKAMGLRRIAIPKGFEGLIDEKGKLFTIAGLEINGVPGAQVTMNQKYNPDKDNTYVFTSSGVGQVSVQKYYTKRWRELHKKKRFETVKGLANNIKQVRLKWIQDLEQPKVKMNSKLAAICELGYQVQGRIGSLSSKTDGKTTYGLSTLKIKHVKVLPNMLIFRYHGKKGVLQVHKYKTNDKIGQLVRKVVLKCLENKQPTDYLFSTENGQPYPNIVINRYLKNKGFKGTFHKLRHLKGTEIATGIVEKADADFHNLKEAENWFKQNVATKVALALGHVKQGGDPLWSTSVQYYIDPELTKGFFSSRGLRNPTWAEKL